MFAPSSGEFGSGPQLAFTYNAFIVVGASKSVPYFAAWRRQLLNDQIGLSRSLSQSGHLKAQIDRLTDLEFGLNHDSAAPHLPGVRAAIMAFRFLIEPLSGDW